MHLTILKASFDACSFYEITRRSSSVELKFVVEFFDNLTIYKNIAITC